MAETIRVSNKIEGLYIDDASKTNEIKIASSTEQKFPLKKVLRF